jgi:hypothetical protein
MTCNTLHQVVRYFLTLSVKLYPNSDDLKVDFKEHFESFLHNNYNY